jgi:hypothetical protein
LMFKVKDVYLTTDLAPLFGVSSKSVARMLDGGHCRFMRLPGSKRRLVRHCDLVAFLKGHENLKPLLGRLTPQRAVRVG